MKCPICRRAMKTNSTDSSFDPSRHAAYERMMYVCEQDDAWITVEVPRKKEKATITYTNWRGETGERNIVPMHLWHGATEWHKEPQWLYTLWILIKMPRETSPLKTSPTGKILNSTPMNRQSLLATILMACLSRVLSEAASERLHIVKIS